jgi:Fe-S-cluster containining protein
MDEEVAQTRPQPSLAQAWQHAAESPQIASRLLAIYQMIADQVASRGPACWASGRCCNFRETGHLLYVTGLEAAFHLCNARTRLTVDDLQASIDRGDCPFLRGNLCGEHEVKPVGCRIYFCDRSAQDWQQDVHEMLITDLRRLHERHGIAYRYGEWRSMLRQVLTHVAAG